MSKATDKLKTIQIWDKEGKEHVDIFVSPTIPQDILDMLTAKPTIKTKPKPIRKPRK